MTDNSTLIKERHERLAIHADWLTGRTPVMNGDQTLNELGADIDELLAEARRLREALESIATTNQPWSAQAVCTFARKALQSPIDLIAHQMEHHP